MIKKNIAFKNYDGVPVTDTFYFHLSQTELLRWEASLPDGGVGKYFTDTMESGDGGKIMAFMEDFLGRAYGKKSDDGKTFTKSPELLAEFKSSAAYDTFFMDLVTNPNEAAEFLNGIVPAELAANVEKMTKLQEVQANVARQHPSDDAAKLARDEREPVPLSAVSDPAKGGNVFEPKEGQRVLSESEMREMDPEELRSGLAEGRFILGYKP